MKIIEIIQEIKKIDPEKKGLSKLKKSELQKILENLSGKEIVEEKQETYSDYEVKETIEEKQEKDYFTAENISYDESDYSSSKYYEKIEKYLDQKPKKVINGKASFKAFLESINVNLENFPSSSDFILNQYRKVLAKILWDFRKSVLETYKSTLRYRIGKDIYIERKYTGKSRFLPSIFSYQTSKNFPKFWQDAIDQWDASEEIFLENEEKSENHLHYLNSSLKVSLFNESMNFNSLLSIEDEKIEEIEESKERKKRQSAITSKFPVNDSTGLLIGYSVIIKNNDSLLDHYFQSI